ncbi:hypothetical protein [Priestia koreensis]|uniref:Uncharacterized protein n=1 Tax=Priestia koreensis TaxID=284581 RepID=A0A0M0LHR9_9BACI|nr:hypothetical protein [Priestia koreensis]KOO50604.1 hypothetical protein AMD01_02325 [Priestia koreensis]MCM3003181.1 hypothetical protein [Priestia koreensis]UNL85985.1 hypothetical protein IE339_05630 [Priestia koreensis]
MKSIQDALYNWLTIKKVADARPDDYAAQETFTLFDHMLKDDHHVENVTIIEHEEMYEVIYSRQQEEKKTRFPKELVDAMYDHIKREPEKFKSYPLEEKR